MIIVQTFHSYYPVLGGIERAMQQLGEELVRMGHEVYIITSTFGATGRPKLEEINGVYVYRTKAWTLHYPDLTIPREMPLKLLKEADIVQGWEQNSFFTYRVLRKAKEIGKPVAMYFIGVDYLKKHYNPLLRIFGYQYQTWITTKISKLTDLALVTNDYDKDLLERKYKIRPIVLPHGVDESYLKTPNMAEQFRAKYGIEGKIISYIARIHATKGLDLLVRAFAEVIKHVPDALLIVAGKGDESYLRKCLAIAERLGIKNKVKYLGYISEEDKIGLIDASEVVVLPTRHAGESYPLLLDEVASRRKVMVVTNVSRALASRAMTLGFIVVNPNTKDLAQGIINAIREKHEVKALIKTWKTIAAELLELYNKTLKEV